MAFVNVGIEKDVNPETLMLIGKIRPVQYSEAAQLETQTLTGEIVWIDFDSVEEAQAARQSLVGAEKVTRQYNKRDVETK